MQRVAILAGAAAVGAAVLLLTQRTDSAAHSEAARPPAMHRAQPSAPGRIAGNQSHGPARQQPLPAPRSIGSELASALGSDQSDLLSLFQNGTRAGASLGEQYIAHEIIYTCLPSILRLQHAEMPGASGETVNEVNA